MWGVPPTSYPLWGFQEAELLTLERGLLRLPLALLLTRAQAPPTPNPDPGYRNSGGIAPPYPLRRLLLTTVTLSGGMQGYGVSRGCPLLTLTLASATLGVSRGQGKR